MSAIGIDVGGTNVRVALVDEDGTVRHQARAGTPRGDAEALARTIGELVAEHPAELPVGVGIAGAVDGDGVLVFGPNIRMEGQQVRAPLEAEVGRRVAIANDASVAAWGEHRVGAGHGHDDVVLLTLGTGVGGGVVVAGRLLLGARGAASELGHVVVEDGGALCSCGNRGCLEAYASGRNLGMGDRSPAEVVAAAREGDEEALAHMAGVGHRLGVGIHNVVAAFDPSIVLIGGGAGEAAFELLVEPAEARLAALLVGKAHRRPPPVERAQLGDDAGVVGAALLAIDRESRDGADR